MLPSARWPKCVLKYIGCEGPEGRGSPSFFAFASIFTFLFCLDTSSKHSQKRIHFDFTIYDYDSVSICPDPNFLGGFGQHVVTNTYTTTVVYSSSSRRKTCGMRYAKAFPVVFRFLPELLLVVELVAPEHLSPR